MPLENLIKSECVSDPTFIDKRAKLIFYIERTLLYGLFLLLPYYGAKSGGFQFVDVIIMMLVILGIYTGSFFTFFQHSNLFKFRVPIFITWVLYTFINLLYHFLFSDGAPFTLYVYPFYGLIIVAVFYGLCEKIYKKYGPYMWYKILINALVISLIIPILNLLFIAPRYFMYALSFNNPNQVVFFVLMQYTMLFYLFVVMRNSSHPIKITKFFVIINLSLILLFVATSRSGLFLVILYFFLLFFLLDEKKIVNKKALVLCCTLGLLGGIVLFYIWINVYKPSMGGLNARAIINDFITREVNSVVRPDSFMSFIFGIGLGKTEIEIHNNFVAILQQSGVLAFCLYIVLHVQILFDLIKKRWFYGVPFLVYILVSCFHFTQRSRYIWIIFAFTFLILSLTEKYRVNVDYSTKQS